MYVRIAVNLGSRRLENPRVDPLGETKHIHGTHHIGLDGLHGIVLVVNRRSRTGEIVDLIDLQKDRLNNIGPNQLEQPNNEQMLYVFGSTREEIVEPKRLR